MEWWREIFSSQTQAQAAELRTNDQNTEPCNQDMQKGIPQNDDRQGQTLCFSRTGKRKSNSLQA